MGRRWCVQIQGRVIPSKALMYHAIFLLTTLLSLSFGYILNYIFLSLALQNLPIIHKHNNSSHSSTSQTACFAIPEYEMHSHCCTFVHCFHSLEYFLLLCVTGWFNHLSIACIIMKSYLTPSKLSQKQFISSSEFLYHFVDTVLQHLTGCISFSELL